MRWIALLCLCLVACSSDPAPTDVPAADAVAVADGPEDVVDVTEDRSAVVDAGTDVGFDAGQLVDVGAEMAAPETGAPDAGDAGADVVAVADVRDVPGVDVAGDAGAVDVVAVADAGADAPDVGEDRPEAVDVPRDAGPADGGPVAYDLAAARGALEAHFAGRRTLPPPTSTSRDCPDDPSAVSCSVAAGVVNFSLGACFGTSLTGRFVLGDAGPSTLSIAGGGGGSSATTLRFATGPRVGGRRSFHVQFSAAPFQGEVGFGGIPGRTVDPALADLWLLGCASD